jgi:hypothetical protein
MQLPATPSAASDRPREKRPAASAPSRQREDDDEPTRNRRADPDDEADRPRKKPRKKRTERGLPLWVIFGAVAVVLVGMGGGGVLIAYALLGSRDGSVGALLGGKGVKYVPRESEKKMSQFMKDHEHEAITDEQVFAIMGEPTRRTTPITAQKNGQMLTIYEAFWEVPGSGVKSTIGFVNGRMNGAIIGLEVTSGSEGKK